MISPDDQELLRECFDSLHAALRIIDRIVEDYGDEEAKRAYLGLEFEMLAPVRKLRAKFDVPFDRPKENQ